MKIAFISFLLLFSPSLSAQQISAIDSIINTKMYAAQKYLSNKNGSYNEEEAFKLYLECAKLGKHQAMQMVGLMYRDGKGTTKNITKATIWFLKAAKEGNTNAWFHLGMLYKNTSKSEQDFFKSFQYFAIGTLAGNALCEYNQAYMLFKGLGCKQDYKQAVSLFAKEAKATRGDNRKSMYFLGIALRNGYGVAKNIDSAKYWLKQASQRGDFSAKQELRTINDNGENNEPSSTAKAIQPPAYTSKSNLNTYQKIEHKLSETEIEGIYKGYIITYDWSGKNIIDSTAIELTILHKNGILSGVWIQSDTLAIPFQATITPHSIVFTKTAYYQKTHYSYNSPVLMQFESAKLQQTKLNDSIYIVGNIQMYLPELKEPYKPQYLSLVKYKKIADRNEWVDITKDDGSIFVPNTLKAYPNPFTNIITIDFELKQPAKIITSLRTTEGKTVYTNTSTLSETGFYTLPLKVNQNLNAGIYIVDLKSGNQHKTLKVIKL